MVKISFKSGMDGVKISVYNIGQYYFCDEKTGFSRAAKQMINQFRKEWEQIEPYLELANS